MTSVRSYEDLLAELQRRLNTCRYELQLWSAVKVLKKKDGSDFAVKSKSFENARWEIPNYGDDLHPELVVGGYNNCNRAYEEFKLYMYLYTDELKDDDPRKTQGRAYASWSRETYVLTPDEVLERIQGRIEKLNKLIASYEEQINRSPQLYDEFFAEVRKAFEHLTDACSDLRDDPKFPTSLEYLVFDVLKNKSML